MLIWIVLLNLRKPHSHLKTLFFNDLTQEPLTQEAYQQAQQVWEKMGCQDMGDDHDVYLTTDTLLLADVFKNFRNICLAT